MKKKENKPLSLRFSREQFDILTDEFTNPINSGGIRLERGWRSKGPDDSLLCFMVLLQPGLPALYLQTRHKLVQLMEVWREGDERDEGLEEEAGGEVRENELA